MKKITSAVFVAAVFVLAVAGFKVAGAAVTGNPMITSVIPNHAAVGASVTIFGQNLAGASMVEVVNSSGQIVSSITIPNASSTANENLTFTIPSTLSPAVFTPGTAYQIKVVTAGGTSTGLSFVFTAPTASATTNSNTGIVGNPIITSVNQSQVGVTTTVTLYGQNLAGATSIQFINSDGTTIAFISDLSYVTIDTSENLTFVVPATIENALLPGAFYQIKVVTPAGTTAGENFALGANTPPAPISTTASTTPVSSTTSNPVITACPAWGCNGPVTVMPVTPIATSTTSASTTTSTPGTATSTEPMMASTSTPGTAASAGVTSRQTLQLKLNQLITLLLQLLQQASQQGLLSTSQLNSFLGAISGPQASSSTSLQSTSTPTQSSTSVWVSTSTSVSASASASGNY